MKSSSSKESSLSAMKSSFSRKPETAHWSVQSPSTLSMHALSFALKSLPEAFLRQSFIFESTLCVSLHVFLQTRSPLSHAFLHFLKSAVKADFLHVFICVLKSGGLDSLAQHLLLHFLSPGNLSSTLMSSSTKS